MGCELEISTPALYTYVDPWNAVMKVLLAAWLFACTVFAQDAKNSTGQQPLPPIYLNHANIVVSPALYEAINQSKFLNAEFSNGGEHTVTGAYSGRAPYTNISVRGKKTYLEIKNADSLDEKGLKRNPILFIMSIDDRTQLAAVGQSFEREHIHAPIETAMRTFNGHEVKWHDDTDTSKWSDNLDPAHNSLVHGFGHLPGLFEGSVSRFKTRRGRHDQGKI